MKSDVSRWLAIVVSAAVLAGGMLLSTGSFRVAMADPQERQFRVTDISFGCGVYSSAIWIRRATGRRVTYTEVAAIADQDGDGLCSLADVCRALHSAGIGVDAFRADGPGPEHIPRQRAIVRLVRGPVETSIGHFCYVEPRSGDEYVVYYPPLGVSMMSAEALARNWDGTYVAESPARLSPAGLVWILPGVLLMIVGSVMFFLGWRGTRRRKS